MTNRPEPIPHQISDAPEPGCDCISCSGAGPSAAAPESLYRPLPQLPPLKPLPESVLVKPGPSNKPLKKPAKRKEEEFDWGPDDDDEDYRPCNIIIRNIRAVSTMSRTLKEARLLEQQNINRLNAWPRPSRRRCKKKKKPIPKKSSMLDLMKVQKDCKCELVARATKANVHTRLSLAEHRDAINKTPSETTTNPGEEVEEEEDQKKK